MPTYRADDGSDLWFDERGDPGGPLVLVLAGGAAAHPDYLGDLGGLTARLVVPHLRGVGRSAGAPLQDFWTVAGDVDALRRHLGVEQVTVLGHSAGTRQAVAFAAQHPSRVEALVLVTPPPAWLVDVPSDRGAMVDARRGEPAVDAALAVVPDITDDATLDAYFAATAPLAYARWGSTEQAHAAGMRTVYAANRAFLSATPPDDLHALLRQVVAPVLVVAGEQDTTTGYAPVLAVAELFPDGRALTVQDCGHFPWVEQPAAFRAAVEPFLGTAD